jgi:hypothetical protein
MLRSFLAGGAFFAIVFAFAFALGVLRVLITGPRLGETAAVLLEIPFVLAASWRAAKWCVAAFAVGPAAGDRLAMGFVAFGLTTIAELGLSVILFSETVAEHFATYGRLVGMFGLSAQLLFAFIPLAQSPRT